MPSPVCSTSPIRPFYPISQPLQTLQQNPQDEQGQPTYSVAFNGHPVLAPSKLGLMLDVKDFGADRFKAPFFSVREVKDTYSVVAGKTKVVADHYNEVTLNYEEAGPSARRMTMAFRVYDNGVAFRYILSDQPDFKSFGVLGEQTRFAVGTTLSPRPPS